MHLNEFERTNLRLLTSSGHINIQIQAVLALICQQRQQLFQVQEPSAWKLQQRFRPVTYFRQVLRANRRKRVGQPGVFPHGRRHRGHVAKWAQGRRRVRHPEKGLDGRLVEVPLDDDTAERTVLCRNDTGAVFVHKQTLIRVRFFEGQENQHKEENSSWCCGRPVDEEQHVATSDPGRMPRGTTPIRHSRLSSADFPAHPRGGEVRARTRLGPCTRG